MRPRIQFIAACTLLKVSLDLCYVFFLSPTFARHFLFPFPLELSAPQFIESYFWVWIVVSFVPFDTRDLSGAFFTSVLVFLFIPLAVMYGLDSQQTHSTLLLTVMAITISFITAKAKMPKLLIPVPRKGHLMALILSSFGIATFLAVSFLSGSISNLNFDLSQVYEFREAATQRIDYGILGYTNLWAQKIFTPFLLAMGLARRNWLLVVFCVLLHVFYTGITQHRQHMFVPLLVIFVWYIYNRGFSFAAGYTIIALILGASTLIVVIFELNALGALILRRAFFVGAGATDGWVNYFLNHPKVYFSNKLLAPFLQTDYNGEDLAFFLGDHLAPGLDVGYNAGIVANGFAHIGVFGVVLYAVIMGVFLRTANSIIASGAPVFMVVAVLFVPIRTAWTASDLLSSLLSHGLMIGLLTIWLFAGSGNPVRMREKRRSIV